MKSKLAIFGGTGGLGKWVTPLLEPDFEVMALGSKDVDVNCFFKIEEFFEDQGYVPYIIYMASHNFDAVIHKYLSEEFTAQIMVNIKGFIDVIKYALPSMRANKYGRILYTSSILSERPIPGTGIYAATKAFSDNIVKTCALENAKYNITCNSLQLGYFDAGLTHKVPKNIMEQVTAKIPVGRLGNAIDLNRVIRFIFESSYLTGVNIPFSGGLNLV